MAKGKKGPALFEVIRASQQKQLELQQKQTAAQQKADAQQKRAGEPMSASSWLTSPTSWLKGRQAAAEQDPQFGSMAAVTEASTRVVTPVVRREVPTPKPVAETIKSEATISFAPVSPAVRAEVPAEPKVEAKPTPAADSAVPFADYRVVPVATPAPEVEHHPAPPVESFASAAARKMREEIAAASRRDESDSSFDRSFDRPSDVSPRDPAASTDDERDTWIMPSWLRPNYMTGLAAGIALLAVGATAFLMLRPAAPTQTAMSPRPDVLNVRPTNASTAVVVVPPKVVDNTAVGRTNVAPTGDMTINNAKPITPVATAKRTIGLQYVVLLSFPREGDAKSLIDFLAKNGVAVTAERALPGYSPSWYSVVTVKGFERTKANPEYDAYVTQLKKLMDQFAEGSKFKKSFKPDVYTWRGAN